MAPTSPLGTLTILPPQIRQMIYALALPNLPSLALTSTSLLEETWVMLQEHGGGLL